MEHEKRKRKQYYKRTATIVLAIPILVVIAVLIVFYAFGYRIDFSQKKIYLSSVLYLRSQPLGAQVYLNNNYIGNTKLTQKNVKPGTYNLKLVEEGFMPWNATIDVPAYSVVELDPYLFYQQPQEKQIAIDQLLASDQQKVIFKKDNQIDFCDLPCSSFQTLNNNLSGFKNVYLTTNQVYFEYANYYVAINLSNLNQTQLAKPINEVIKKTVFNNRGVYVLTNANNLYQLTTQTPVLIQNGVNDITTNTGWLYFITASGELSAWQDQTTNIATRSIVTTNFNVNQINISSSSLMTFPNQDVFLIQNNNYFLLNNNQAQFVATNIQNYITVDGYSAWLTHDGGLYLQEPDSTAPKFINRYFNNPDSIFFFSPEYIALQYPNQIKMIETTTKQEFDLLSSTKTFNYVYPSSETVISRVTSNQILNDQITNSISFWDKILTIFRR